MNIIPSKDRKEWRQLLNGELDISFSNFFYQAKILQAREQVKRGKMNIEDAVNEIYELTTQYCETEQVFDDITQIFGIETIRKKVISDNKSEFTDPVIKDLEKKAIISETTNEIFEKKDNKETEIDKPAVEKKQLILSKEIAPKQTKKEAVNLEKEREEARKQIDKRLEEERQRRENTKKRNALVSKTSIKKPINARFTAKQKPQKIKPQKKNKSKNKSFWDNIFGK